MDKKQIEYLRVTIKVVKDYPKKGVNFKDVSSILVNAQAFQYAIDLMAEKIKGLDYDALAGQDVPALFGITLSYKLKKTFYYDTQERNTSWRDNPKEVYYRVYS